MCSVFKKQTKKIMSNETNLRKNLNSFVYAVDPATNVPQKFTYKQFAANVISSGSQTLYECINLDEDYEDSGNDLTLGLSIDSLNDKAKRVQNLEQRLELLDYNKKNMKDAISLLDEIIDMTNMKN